MSLDERGCVLRRLMRYLRPPGDRRQSKARIAGASSRFEAEINSSVTGHLRRRHDRLRHRPAGDPLLLLPIRCQARSVRADPRPPTHRDQGRLVRQVALVGNGQPAVLGGNLDRKRPNKKAGFVVDLGRRVSPIVTPGQARRVRVRAPQPSEPRSGQRTSDEGSLHLTDRPRRATKSFCPVGAAVTCVPGQPERPGDIRTSKSAGLRTAVTTATAVATIAGVLSAWRNISRNASSRRSKVSARDGIRTRMPVRAARFKLAASAVPPPGPAGSP